MSSLLAELTASLDAARAARLQALAPEDRPGPDELASARRFRRAWDSHQLHDRVEQAVSRRPANAGPLNSHVLVLQSLDLMRELSPAYLRRFLAHVESLQWLDRAREQYPRTQGRQPAAAKPARRPRQKSAKKADPPPS